MQADVGRTALVNVGIGNIESVERALNFIGVDYESVSDPDGLHGADTILLPGVGAFKAGMAALDAHNMVEPIRAAAKSGRARLFGICLGMQLLGTYSEEGDCEGLCVVPFSTRRIRPFGTNALKIPHVGFATVHGYHGTGLFAGLPPQADFYFTHSYGVEDAIDDANIAWTRDGLRVVGAFDAGRVCGAQFHPEKSQSNGLRILKNYFEPSLG
jgi:imidazole glycerol-phosphate synthase subunit HisH